MFCFVVFSLCRGFDELAAFWVWVFVRGWLVLFVVVVLFVICCFLGLGLYRLTCSEFVFG